MTTDAQSPGASVSANAMLRARDGQVRHARQSESESATQIVADNVATMSVLISASVLAPSVAIMDGASSNSRTNRHSKKPGETNNNGAQVIKPRERAAFGSLAGALQ